LMTAFGLAFRPEALGVFRLAARQGDVIAGQKMRLLERPVWLQKVPVLTGTVLLLVLVLCVMVREVQLDGIQPTADFLRKIGGVTFDAIQRGEAWRFLTAPLLHGNLKHIVYNATALFVFGMLLEVTAGFTALLVCFVFSGMTGALMFSLFGAHEPVSVGASGAIFGLMGFYVVQGAVDFQGFWDRLKTGMPLLLANLLGTVFIANVDHFGHVVGLLGGLMLGAVWRTPTLIWRRIALLIGVLALTVGTGFVFRELNWVPKPKPVETEYNRDAANSHPVFGSDLGTGFSTYCVEVPDENGSIQLMPTSLTPNDAPSVVRVVPCSLK
jgi:membrane associated rhomboid family serine protease